MGAVQQARVRRAPDQAPTVGARCKGCGLYNHLALKPGQKGPFACKRCRRPLVVEVKGAEPAPAGTPKAAGKKLTYL